MLLVKQPGLGKVDLRFDPDGLSCEMAAPPARMGPPHAGIGRPGVRFPPPRSDREVCGRPSRPAEI
jgi:hypothetical protein